MISHFIRQFEDAKQKLMDLQKTISEISSDHTPQSSDHTPQPLQTKSAPQLLVTNDTVDDEGNI